MNIPLSKSPATWLLAHMNATPCAIEYTICDEDNGRSAKFLLCIFNYVHISYVRMFSDEFIIKHCNVEQY